MQEFLNSLGKATAKSYRRGLDLFLEFYGKTVDQILEERKDDLTPKPNESIVETKQRANRYEKILESFHKWQLEPIHTIKGKSNQPYEINTARTNCLGIMQIFRYYNMSIVLRSGSPVSQTVISTGDFVLMPEHVRSMFHVAKDLRSKLLISMANDLGWRIGDLLSILRSELPNLEQETPIQWVRITTKEKQVSKTCLSDTTVALLREYLFTFPTHNPFLFNSNGQGHIDQETVNSRIRDLARDSNIDIANSKLTFHCFRDMIISTAKNLSIDGDIIKLMVGKSISKAMMPYLTGVDVKTAFLKLQSVTRINGEILKEQSQDLVKALGMQITELTNHIETMRKDIANIIIYSSEKRQESLEVWLIKQGWKKPQPTE